MVIKQIARKTRGMLCYLASPYSHEVIGEDGHWRETLSEWNAARVCRLAALFAAQGVTAISPVLSSSLMTYSTVCGFENYNPPADPLDAEYWTYWYGPLLSSSQCVIVHALNGWRESAGIWQEVEAALKSGKPIYLTEEKRNPKV
jgi:hypothetical protein